MKIHTIAHPDGKGKEKKKEGDFCKNWFKNGGGLSSGGDVEGEEWVWKINEDDDRYVE